MRSANRLAACRAALAAVLAASLPVGCGSTDEPDEGSIAAPKDTCPAGQVSGVKDTCIPVGIQGCTPEFIDDDGVCRPSLARCPAGRIPRFDQGCVPVGIQGCAPDFLTDDGLCRPDPARCRPGEIPIPGEGCVSLDGPDGCGHGTWGAIAELPGDVHVDPAAAATDPDGTRARPFSTIQAALDAAHAGARVILAAGEYPGPVAIDRELEIIGRCASLVTIRVAGGSPEQQFVLGFVGPGGAARGLRLTGDAMGLYVEGQVEASGVHIEAASLLGAVANDRNADLTITRSLIERTLLPPGDPRGDRLATALARGGATLRVVESTLRGADVGIFAFNAGTRVEVQRSVIEGLEPDGFGQGVRLEDAELVSEETAILGATVGVMALQPKARADVRDGYIELRVDAADNPAAHEIGAALSLGAQASFASTVVTGSAAEAVLAVGPETQATFTGDLFYNRADLPPEVLPAGGILAVGARLSLSGNTFSRMRETAISTGELDELTGGDAASSVDGEGNIVEGCRVDGRDPPEGQFGVAVLADEPGSTIALRSSYIAASEGIGVAAQHGASLELASTLVEATSPRARDGMWGAGALCSEAGRLALASSAIVDHRGLAVMLSGCEARIEGSLLGATRAGLHPAPGGGTLEGIADGLATEESRLDLRGSVVRGCERAGIFSIDTTGAVAATRVDDNRFGLVLERGAQPELAADNEIERNRERDRLVNEGDLAVPDAPAPLP